MDARLHRREQHGDDANTVTAVPALDRPATLMFEAGTVTVDTGCNTGSGGYQASGDEITFGSDRHRR